MLIEEISLVNFRNHQYTEFRPGKSVTVIHGKNGSGKTGILEAIHYCAFTRGFSNFNDRDSLAFGEQYFRINSTFISDYGGRTNVRVNYSKEKEKQVYVNEQEIPVFSKHIGTIPCITFFSGETAIVNGSPSERRRFIDSAICQHDRKYMENLLQYRRVLQQRNALLIKCSESSHNRDELEIWTDQLARQASAIIITRKTFINNYLKYFKDIYTAFPKNKDPEIIYNCTLFPQNDHISENDLYLSVLEKYRINTDREIYRGQTYAGPHRDDLQLYSDTYEVRKYASQGQQRLYHIAMKLALHRYLDDKNGETPITLLDDLFSELDACVVKHILVLLEQFGQTVITSTEPKKGQGIELYEVNGNQTHKKTLPCQERNIQGD